MRISVTVAFAALLTACSQSTQSQTVTEPTPAPTANVLEGGPCVTGFVEIVPDKPACDIALEADGSLSLGGRRTPPIIASYQDGANGQVAIAAREVILFPPAPQSGLRVVQACETADADSLCWTMRLMDPKTAGLREITAGKYGPSHWISWSPGEQRVALVSRNEGAEWLHVIDTKTGATTTYPGETESANWQIDRDSFAWSGEHAFTVKVRTCESCAPEARSFTLP